MSVDLSVKVAGVTFKNPIITASGTFGFGREYNQFYPISALGGISTKGMTLERRDGNPVPRIAEVSSGILNSVGLQNPGVDVFIEKDLPWLKEQNTVIIANIAGKTEEDYCEIARRLSDTAVDMLELNISCPNVKAGGMSFGVLPEGVAKITNLVRKNTDKPLIVKLTPNVSNIADNARAAEDAGADAVSLINTLSGMAIDIRTKRPVLANRIGGLSGPCVKPVALRMVYDVYKAVKIPIIGMGGITCAEDVVEFLLAGATAVQVGTANFTNPMASFDIVNDFRVYCEKNQTNPRELCGGLIVE